LNDERSANATSAPSENIRARSGYLPSADSRPVSSHCANLWPKSLTRSYLCFAPDAPALTGGSSWPRPMTPLTRSIHDNRGIRVPDDSIEDTQSLLPRRVHSPGRAMLADGVAPLGRGPATAPPIIARNRSWRRRAPCRLGPASGRCLSPLAEPSTHHPRHKRNEATGYQVDHREVNGN